MQATAVRDASGRVIVALMAASRSRATIKRHEVEFNAFAVFLEARGGSVSISSLSGPGAGSRGCGSRPVPDGPSSHAGH
jgi:hypothetical protein